MLAARALVVGMAAVVTGAFAAPAPAALADEAAVAAEESPVAAIEGAVPGRAFAIAEDGRGGYEAEGCPAVLRVQPSLADPGPGTYPEADPAGAGADPSGWELVRRAAWSAPVGLGGAAEALGVWPSAWQDGTPLDAARVRALLGVVAAQLLYGEGDAAMAGWPEELAAWVRRAVVAETPAAGDGTLVGSLMAGAGEPVPGSFRPALLDTGEGRGRLLVLPAAGAEGEGEEAPLAGDAASGPAEEGVAPEEGLVEPEEEPAAAGEAEEPAAPEEPAVEEGQAAELAPEGEPAAEEAPDDAEEPGAPEEVPEEPAAELAPEEETAAEEGQAAPEEELAADPVPGAGPAGLAPALAAAPAPDAAPVLAAAPEQPGAAAPRIESVGVSWVTQDGVPDGDPARLSLAPGTDDPFSVRALVEAAFSGQRDLLPGEVSVTIPKSLFTGRDGQPADTAALSVPADPDSGAQFSYSDLGDRYVLTNTATIGAASAVSFEVSYRGVVPHTVVDSAAGGASAPFFAKVSLAAPEGAAEAESGAIDATVDTRVRVTRVYARAMGVHEEWPASWPQALMPDDPGAWLYADWYAWCGVAGNQEYALEARGDAAPDGVPGAVLLGSSGAGGPVPGDGAASATERLSGLTSFGIAEHGRHFYAAYPKEGLDLAAGGTLSFVATYALTAADDGERTSASAGAEAAYAPQAFEEPPGHVGLDKEGWGAVTSYQGSGRVGVYGSALNSLCDGEDVTARFRASAVALGWPWTAGEGLDAASPDAYGQRPYALEVEDSELLIETGGQERALGEGDYEVAALEVSRPVPYAYARFGSSGNGYRDLGGAVGLGLVPAGGWGYRADASAPVPAVQVFGRLGAEGEWRLMATMSFAADGCASAAFAGAGAEGGRVTFPPGVTAWLVRAETSLAGLSLEACPTVRLFASGAAGEAAREAVRGSAEPSARLLNRAQARVAQDGSAVAESGTRQGVDRLEGALLAVRQSQSVSYTNDPSARLVRLHYRAVVEERSNMADFGSYRAAAASGALAAETGGTWYELLPAGVVPDLSSVSLRGQDRVLGARAVEDWRGTGRMLLVVEASLVPAPAGSGDSGTGLRGCADEPALSFDAVYAWEDVADRGRDLSSVVAFESGNASLGSVAGYRGEPDDPAGGRHRDSRWACAGVEEAMADLDPDSDGPRFVYARSDTRLDVDVSALASLSKQASVNGSGAWGDGLAARPLNVFEGGSYLYRLRVANDRSSSACGIVLFDAVERHVPGEDTPDRGDAQWRGRLAGVDASQAERAGAAPVVYYSTLDGAELDAALAGTPDLSDGSAWSRLPESPSEELLARVTAVAVDCSLAADGGAFTLGPGEALSVTLRMRAPSAEELAAMAGPEGAEAWYDAEAADESGLSGGGHAYNAACVSLAQVLEDGTVSATQVVRREYVKVGVVPFEVAVSKAWDDDGDRDGLRPASVTARLLADGADTGLAAVLDEGNGWSAAFCGIPAARPDGTAVFYAVAEDPVEGYASSSRLDPSPGGLSVALINSHAPEVLSVSGRKLWEDDGDAARARPASVRVALYADGARVGEQTVSAGADGLWSYSFDGLHRFRAGREVSYTVLEEYVPGYVTSYEGHDIVNTYRPFGTLVISKRVAGATSAASQASFAFSIAVTRPDGSPDGGRYPYVTSDGRSGEVPDMGAVELKDGQTAVVSGLPSECSYRVAEQRRPGFSPVSSQGAEGVVRAGQASEAAFVNSYSSSGSAVVRATKTLSGRALAAGQFAFQLVGPGGEVARNARCAADGSVVFGAVGFTQDDDGTALRYRVREVVPDDAVNAQGTRWADAGEEERAAGGFSLLGYTYDSHEEEVVITVSDNGDGTLSAQVACGPQGPLFANSYRAEGRAALVAWKTVQGSLPCDLHRAYGVPDADIEEAARESGRSFEEEGAEFLPRVLGVPWRYSFGLYGEDGARVASAENDASGTVAFPAVAYTEADAGRTFFYVAREDVPEEAALPDGTVWGDASAEQRAAGGFALGGVVFGGEACAWTAAVSDNGDGTLSVEVRTVDPATREPVGEAPVLDNGLAPGTLVIAKDVEGEAADPGRLFSFEVALSGPAAPEGALEYQVRAAASEGEGQGEGQDEGGQA